MTETVLMNPEDIINEIQQKLRSLGINASIYIENGEIKVEVEEEIDPYDVYDYDDLYPYPY